MIRRLINRIQGKTWGAVCMKCEWKGGRTDLTEDQSYNRARGHARNAHGDYHGVGIDNKNKRHVVIFTILPKW